MPKMISIAGLALLASVFSTPVLAQDCNAAGTVGSGGSAAAGGTSASTLGTAAACQTDDGTIASIGSAGSAAAADGKAKSQTKVNENPNQLRAQSQAQAMDQGTLASRRRRPASRAMSCKAQLAACLMFPAKSPLKAPPTTWSCRSNDHNDVGLCGVAEAGSSLHFLA